MVRGDPFRLRQVLINLINNAVKFTGQGQVIVRANVVSEARDASRVYLSVEDTGVGIAPEAREKVFERFAQADGSTTRQFGGTGLGLAICRRLVELMGGAIGLESQLGKGTRLSLIHICFVGSRAGRPGGLSGHPPDRRLPGDPFRLVEV